MVLREFTKFKLMDCGERISLEKMGVRRLISGGGGGGR
jgi:hypothetical protein